MTKTTKDLNAEIAKLRATARAAEKTEYETFGRWVVDQLVPSSRGAASERIEAAKPYIDGLPTELRATESVVHVDAESVDHGTGASVNHESAQASNDWSAAGYDGP